MTGSGDGLAVNVVRDITSSKDAGDVRASAFSLDQIAIFIRVEAIAEGRRIWLMPDGDEDALEGEFACGAVLEIF